MDPSYKIFLYSFDYFIRDPITQSVIDKITAMLFGILFNFKVDPYPPGNI